MTSPERAVDGRWRVFPASIRLRVTVWYTLLLALVLLASLLLIHVLLERQVQTDLDHRVLAIAEDVAGDVQTQANGSESPRLTVPDLDAYTSPGLFVQVLDARGTVLASSEGTGDTSLPVNDFASGGSAPVFRTSTVNGVGLRTVRLPILVGEGTNGQLVGSVVVGESFLSLDRTLDRLQNLLAILALLGIALVAAGGWFLAGRALRPVGGVTAAAAAIAARAEPAEALTTRLAVPGTNDEVARLAATFNAMLDRLERAFAAQRRLVEMQRRFVADASHDLRTPLTTIRSNGEVLLQQVRTDSAALSRDDLIEGLEGINSGALRMSHLVEGLLRLARAEADPPRSPEPVALAAVAREALRTTETLAQGKVVQLEADESVVVLGDTDRLSELVVVLVDNAMRYTPSGGQVTVRVERRREDAALLTVQDTGPGIPPEHLPHVFERFYRSDLSRSRYSGGSGLGLAIARAIVEAHHGKIEAESTVGVGTTMRVTLPALPPGANAPATQAHKSNQEVLGTRPIESSR